jgi:hypothetical protein
MADYPRSVMRPRLPMTPEEILDAADVLGNAGCLAASVRGPVDGIEGGLSRADSLSCDSA